MATGDITVTIPSTATTGLATDGAFALLDIEGFTTGKTVDFGSGRGNKLVYADIASAKIVFTVTSLGYTTAGVLSTIVRTVYGRMIVRKPDPNEAQNNEPTATSILIALSEYIYAKDQAGVGNSGTDITVTIAAGAIRNDGGSNELSNALTGATVVNSSGLAYPLPIGRWDYYAGALTQDRFKTSLTLAFDAWCLGGIACVILDITGVTSAATATATRTSKTMTQRAASGLYASAYQNTFSSFGSFTQGESVRGRARAFPRVGDTALDTDNYTTAADVIYGRNQPTFICDKNNALDVIRYVAASGGSDSNNGLTSGTPYATISKAVTVDANIIYLLAGTHAHIGATHTQKNNSEWFIVQPAPGVSQASAIVELKATNKTYRTKYLCYSGVTMQQANDSNANMDGGAVNHLRWVNCNFTSAPVALSQPFFDKSIATWFSGCTGDFQSFTVKSFANNLSQNQWDGCIGPIKSGGVQWDNWFWIVASHLDNARLEFPANTKPSPRQVANVGLLYNYLPHFNNSSAGVGHLKVGAAATVTGGFVCAGNVFERVAGLSGNFQFGVNFNCEHMLLWHNTHVGEQLALLMSNTGSSPHLMTNCSMIGHISGEVGDIETDITTTANGGRTGNWGPLYGLHFYGNRMQYQQSEEQHSGWNHYTTAPTFEDDQSTSHGAAGQGDYTPLVNSPQRNKIPAGMRVMTHDLYGTAILDDGTADGGAIQFTTPTAPSVVGEDSSSFAEHATRFFRRTTNFFGITR